MPKGKTSKKAKATEPQPETNGTRYYKHPFVNEHVTINSNEVAMGKPSVTIVLRKDKKAEWGLFQTSDERVQKLISEDAWCKRHLIEISEAEAVKFSKPSSPEKYHMGVASALMMKGKR